MAGGATAGSSRAYRLDPGTLPARSSPLAGGAAVATFIIEHDRAIVRQPSAAGLAAAVSVPLAAYRGVAVRMEAIGDNGDVRGFVELLHADPTLTLGLAMSEEPEEIATDWQAWARALHLPLLIIGQDGSVGEPLAQLGGVILGPPKPRRRHSFFAGRRPRFLTRRKPGRPERMVMVHGREIIARD